MISSGEPFLLCKIIWIRFCYVTTLLLSYQTEPENILISMALKSFCKTALLLSSSSYRKKIKLLEKILILKVSQFSHH